MARKLRISILYNEPVVGDAAARQYIAENGRLQVGTIAPPRGQAVQDMPMPLDLSEVGVMEEMEDI